MFALSYIYFLPNSEIKSQPSVDEGRGLDFTCAHNNRHLIVVSYFLM